MDYALKTDHIWNPHHQQLSAARVHLTGNKLRKIQLPCSNNPQVVETQAPPQNPDDVALCDPQLKNLHQNPQPSNSLVGKRRRLLSFSRSWVSCARKLKLICLGSAWWRRSKHRPCFGENYLISGLFHHEFWCRELSRNAQFCQTTFKALTI